ncbi:TlpA family protein disulfide reductase [Thermomicrobiaceae bacterium CFH 74404]|uniref:TlpA family protein disulfide reductase n=1 Tax=Thermalbibacter longus TaxID=2951981 RepID=A0AA41WDD7_9BACT|nr:TlpA disulfide reductase family protein [Thermalbibacter longus]MCM8747980.1 TlpA family protein disulfide reductase [Thermalbibacter longus]
MAIYTMAGWCLSCIPEAQAWAKLYPEYHQRGVDVLLLSIDPSDTPATLANFSNLAGREVATLPWAVDKDQALTRLLDVRTLDQTIIIDRRGRVAYVDYGPTSPDQLRRVLDQLLQGEL